MQPAIAANKTVSEIAKILHNQAEINSMPNGPLVAAGAGGITAGLPSYAFTKPNQHIGETKALLALLFGLFGMVGALFMPIVGLSLSVAGIVAGTMSHSGTKRKLSTVGIAVSSLAVLFSLGAWAYNMKHDPKVSHEAVQSSSAVFTSNVSTPCYSASFVYKLNIKNNVGSCDMIAFNGQTMNDSTDAYKIYADQSQAINPKEFASIAKKALEKDVKDSLPGFEISSQKVTQFAGSPAYVVNAVNKAQGVTVVEEAVLHQVGRGENVFVIVHAMNGTDSDLSSLESQWQWK